MAIKIYQMAMKYTNTFHSEAFKNISKVNFFGLKTYHLATLSFV
jgi:hypothetical protein